MKRYKVLGVLVIFLIFANVVAALFYAEDKTPNQFIGKNESWPRTEVVQKQQTKDLKSNINTNVVPGSSIAQSLSILSTNGVSSFIRVKVSEISLSTDVEMLHNLGYGTTNNNKGNGNVFGLTLNNVSAKYKKTDIYGGYDKDMGIANGLGDISTPTTGGNWQFKSCILNASSVCDYTNFYLHNGLYYEKNDINGQALFYQASKEVTSNLTIPDKTSRTGIYKYLDIKFSDQLKANVASANTGDWVYEDGYYYYIGVLKPYGTTSSFIDKIYISSKLPNRYKYSIYDLYAENFSIPADDVKLLGDHWNLNSSSAVYNKLKTLVIQ